MYIEVPFKPSVLMNRFLINLRSLDHPGTSDSDAQHFSRFSALNFRVSNSIIGNIGQPLDYGTEQADADEDSDINVDSSMVAVTQTPITLSDINQEFDEPVPGPSHTQWNDAIDIATVETFIVYFCDTCCST
jgi:hypothetical protein